MYYEAFVLFSIYLSIRGRHCSRNNVNMTEHETSHSLVQVVASTEWTQLEMK